jgi:hypothetical protein
VSGREEGEGRGSERLREGKGGGGGVKERGGGGSVGKSGWKGRCRCGRDGDTERRGV